MFKLPGLPSSSSHLNELADFMELLSWIRGTTSERELVSYLTRLDDVIISRTVDDYDDDDAQDDDEKDQEDDDAQGDAEDREDKNARIVVDVVQELDRRRSACGNLGYPFGFEQRGTILRFNGLGRYSTRSLVYLYLLLGTRLNMGNDRIHANIDGSLLLEELSVHVLRNYLGSTRAKSLTFGTSKQGPFQNKVASLCEELGEGQFMSISGARPQARDDNLDSVAWVPFSDARPGKLILFAQCKTGTNWRDSTSELQPDVFVKKWMGNSILVNPTRAFLVSEAVESTRWNEIATETGVLFDRCRVVDFCWGIPHELRNKLYRWSFAAFEVANEMIEDKFDP